MTNHAAMPHAPGADARHGVMTNTRSTPHRWQVEGAHGTAKTLHGLARALRRGLENMKIQALLTAIAMTQEAGCGSPDAAGMLDH